MPSSTALAASGNLEPQSARAGALAAPLPDGQVLIAGGEDEGVSLQSAELFNPATDAFTMLPARQASTPHRDVSLHDRQAKLPISVIKSTRA